MEAAYFRFFKKDDFLKNKKVFSTAYFTIALCGIISTFFLLFFSTPLSQLTIGSDNSDALLIFQIVCLIPLFDCLVVVPYGRMRMERRIKQFAIARLVMIIIAVFLSAYFVIFTELGVIGVFLGQLIACFLAFLYLSPQIIKMLDFNFDKNLFKDMLKFGLPILPSNLSAILLQVADRPILKLFLSSNEVGIYQINAKLAVPMLMFVSIFDTAWKPFFLQQFKELDARKLFSRILTYYILASSFL